MTRRPRITLDPVDRKATFRLKKEFPVGTIVRFWDPADRMGKVVGHAKGRVVILSPLHKRRDVTKHMWEQVAEKHRVEPRLVRIVNA